MVTRESSRPASAEQRLKELGIELPAPSEPFGIYVEAVQTGNLLFLTGMLPTEGHAAKFIGRVGAELDVEAGRKAARVAALNALAVARQYLGSLDKVTRIVRLGVLVATSGHVREQPRVADGASELLQDIFGKGRNPTRLVYGVASLPLGAPVEVEIIFEVLVMPPRNRNGLTSRRAGRRTRKELEMAKIAFEMKALEDAFLPVITPINEGSRRRFLSTAALALAATKLGFVGSEGAQSKAPSSSDGKPEAFFPGFSAEMVETTGTKIHVLRKGSGRPLLLLHGYPETHLTWHKVAPKLAEQFSVVVPDLRGYGDSGKPHGGARHENYSFRAMAQDQVDVMKHYGHDRFFVAAHDRGARAAHRLCLDHPESVEKACLMDIAPTLTMYRGTNRAFATRYMWWFFLIQDYPLPEHMVGLDAKFYLEYIFNALNKTPGAIGPDEMNEYIRVFSNDATIHATTEDFRAAADIDLEMDQADDEAGRKIQCPVHALWGAKGSVGVLWDVLATWREKSVGPMTGKALDCGHFLQEERPQDVISESLQFFDTRR